MRQRLIGASATLVSLLLGCSGGGGGGSSGGELALESARAVANPSISDDEIVLSFSTDVDGATMMDLSHYTLECPIGTPQPLAGASVEIEVGRRVHIRLTQSGVAAVNLPVGSSFLITVNGLPGPGGLPLLDSSAAGVIEGTNVPPALATVSPASGPSAGGTVIQLIGSGFTNASTTQVLVGDTPATGVTSVNGLTMTAVTPSASSGSVDVVVRNPNGESRLRSAFLYGPAVTSISPNEGLTTGGTAVTISGSGFTTPAETQVSLGAALATSVVIVDPQTLTAVTPPGPLGPVDVSVSNSNGSSILRNGFAYRTLPALSTVEPPYGPTSGGTLVTVRGSGFIEASRMTLRFGGAAATSLTAIDGTTLTALTPRGLQGIVDVSIETPFGTATLTGGFQYARAFPLFESSLDQFLNLGPSDIAVADINRDGLLDVVATNELTGPGALTIYLGRGNGDFSTALVYPVRAGNTTPSSLALADVDEDGDLDVAVTEAGVSTATLYLGDGAGGFVQGVTMTMGLGPKSAKLARLDADTHVDLFCVSSRLDALSLRLGDGLGGFGPRSNINLPSGAGTSPSAVVLADFDGDGDLDFATANAGTSTVSVASNDGNAAFTFAPMDLAAGAGPSAILAQDLTGDGILDLATANSGDGTVSVFAGLGTGAFAAARAFPVASGGPTPRPAAIAAADVNRDGRIDLVAANSGSDAISVLPGDGLGSFGPPTTHAVGRKPLAIAAVDLTRDGAPEVVAANSDSHTFSLLLNRSGTLASAPRFDAGLDPADAVSADFDRDGAADLAVLDAAAGTIAVYLGNGAGSFTSGLTLAAGMNPSALQTGDVDGNGFADLAVAVAAEDRVLAFLGDGSGGFATGPSSAVGLGSQTLALSDFDTAGSLDVALGNATDRTVSIATNDGTGRFGAERRFDVTLDPKSIASGDFDEDGRLDIIAVGLFGATGALAVARGDGAGGFFDGPFLTTGEKLMTVAVGDVNADGHLDAVTAGIAFVASGASYALVYLGDGTSNFSVSAFLVGSDPRAVNLADLDADGRLDLVIANRGAASVSVFLGDASGSFPVGIFTFATGYRPSSMAISDVDRSGAPDLLVVNRGGRSVSVLRSRS